MTNKINVSSVSVTLYENIGKRKIKNMEINEFTKVKRNMVNVQEQNEKLIALSSDDQKMVVLNETARFLYENCDGKTIFEIAHELYSLCINQDEISIENIIDDAIVAFLKMFEQGLIEFII